LGGKVRIHLEEKEEGSSKRVSFFGVKGVHLSEKLKKKRGKKEI